MSNIAWIIVAINLIYGSANRADDIHFSTKAECEAVLAEMAEVHARSKNIKYRCVQAVLPLVAPPVAAK